MYYIYLIPLIVGFLIGLASIWIGGKKAAQKRHVASVVAGLTSISIATDFNIFSMVIGGLLGFLGEAIFKGLYNRFRR